MNTVYIGYDSRESIASDVCEYSLKHTTKKPINIKLLKVDVLKKIGIYAREESYDGSVEFGMTRFLVPYLHGFKGWALFCDCDFLWLEDVDKLFAQRDDKYAVMCVQHDYTPAEVTQIDGAPQQKLYTRKNWSSMVLWNCGHPSNQQVTPEMVNTRRSRTMHRFAWLKEEEIGSVSHEWNWLEGSYKEPQDGKPKAIHFTEGGPWFKDFQDVEYADLWIETANKTGVEWSPLDSRFY